MRITMAFIEMQIFEWQTNNILNVSEFWRLAWKSAFVVLSFCGDFSALTT